MVRIGRTEEFLYVRGINLLKESSMNPPARSALRFAARDTRRVHFYPAQGCRVNRVLSA
jgi:hypothetical protein